MRPKRYGGRSLLAAAAASVGLVLPGAVLEPGIAAAAPGTGSADATAAVQQLTAELGRLARDMVAAQDEVTTAQQVSALALDRYQAQQQASADARLTADAAAAAAATAEAALQQAQQQVVDFARSSYIDGSTYPGAASLFTSGGPADLVERVVLLGSAAADRSDVLAELTRRQQEAAAGEAAARAAVDVADAQQRQAAAALTTAQNAERSARQEQQRLAARQADLQDELEARRTKLTELVGGDAAGAIVTGQQAAAADHPSTTPLAVPVLLGNRTFAGAGSEPAARQAVTAALARLGTAYAWGGGGATGPGAGIDLDAGVVGFDCSGLTQYAYAHAGIVIPRNSRAQFAVLPKVATKDLRAGDLVFWAQDPGNPDTIHHVALYLGDGSVVQSPESGDVVSVSPMWWDGYAGAVRPSS
jgi:cell wall-associated NlpC family hydrolase